MVFLFTKAILATHLSKVTILFLWFERNTSEHRFTQIYEIFTRLGGKKYIYPEI